jgi:hypothetical protein
MVVPLVPGEDFPPLPTGGVKSSKDLAAVPGLKVMDALIHPGPTGSISVEERRTVHRNIYRIPL